MVNACHTVPAEPLPRPPGAKGSPGCPPTARGRGLCGRCPAPIPGRPPAAARPGGGTFRRWAGAVVVVPSPQMNHEVIRGNA